MYKVVVTQRLHDKGMALLEESAQTVVAGTGDPRAFAPILADADGLIIRIGSIDRETMRQSSRLRVIGRPGVGVDDVDVAAATELGIPVVVVPGANTRSVAEHALAFIFALAKDLPECDAEMRRGNFAVRSRYRAMELRGKCLGLVGSGSIGGDLGNLAAALGMRVAVYDPFVSEASIVARGWSHAADLDTLLREADVVSLHVPLTERTCNLIGDREFDLMKSSALLVNCARGGVVDEAALFRALTQGRIRGAGTDVLSEEPPAPDNPLLKLRNLIVTPHMAGLTEEAARGVAVGAAEGVLAVLGGNKWPKVANPEVYDHPRWCRSEMDAEIEP